MKWGFRSYTLQFLQTQKRAGLTQPSQLLELAGAVFQTKIASGDAIFGLAQGKVGRNVKCELQSALREGQKAAATGKRPFHHVHSLASSAFQPGVQVFFTAGTLILGPQEQTRQGELW